jgi:hypothetical protein
VTIQVRDRQGKPVGDARIVIHPDTQPVSTPSSQALLEVSSGSDGRAVVLTGIDGLAAETCHLSVYPPTGDSPVTVQRRIDQDEWTIRLDHAEGQPPAQLDLALIIDTTGSMSDELEYLKVEIEAIAQSVREMFPHVDQRYSLIVYRDRGDQYVTRAVDFTRSIDEFRRKIGQQSAAGGGDYPEAMHVALQQATLLSWRENNAARVAFLVGDAPPHDQHASSTLTAVKQLRRQGVRLFPVGASGVGTKAEFIMRASAFLTLGQYLFLTDHSGIGNPHAKPHVPDYQVERLDRAMIRMIASELAGRRLVPSEVIALERGELDDSAPQAAPPGQTSPPNEPQQTGRQAEASGVLPSLAASLAKVVHPRWMMLAALVVGVLICDVVAGRRA